jgi:YgiT-type zinc finger domain-containing protein
VKCPQCNSDLIREIKDVTYTYNGVTIAVQQQGWWCECGEGVLTVDDMRVTENKLKIFKEG